MLFIKNKYLPFNKTNKTVHSLVHQVFLLSSDKQHFLQNQLHYIYRYLVLQVLVISEQLMPDKYSYKSKNNHAGKRGIC